MKSELQQLQELEKLIADAQYQLQLALRGLQNLEDRMRAQQAASPAIDGADAGSGDGGKSSADGNVSAQSDDAADP
jgi:hypothetical protein